MSNEPVWTLPPVTVHQTLMAEQLSGELPWHITEFGIDRFLWPKVQGKTIIGVVDTGVSPTHPTLEGVIIGAKDFTGSRYGHQDMNGHGNHVSSTIASKDFGVAKGHKLAIAKGLSDEGVGRDSQIEAAIDYVCGDMSAMVVNLSLGSDQRSARIVNCIKRWCDKERIFIVAAGNDSGPVNSPANESFVGAVTAIDRQKRLAPFSSRGDASDVCAPGVEIRAAGRGNTYAIMSGTSMAAPWVAGYTAVWMDFQISSGKTATFEDWMKWLTTATADLGKPGKDWEYGLGLPDPSLGFVDSTPSQPTVPSRIGPQSVVVTMSDGTVAVFDQPKK